MIVNGSNGLFNDINAYLNTEKNAICAYIAKSVYSGYSVFVHKNVDNRIAAKAALIDKTSATDGLQLLVIVTSERQMRTVKNGVWTLSANGAPAVVDRPIFTTMYSGTATPKRLKYRPPKMGALATKYIVPACMSSNRIRCVQSINTSRAPTYLNSIRLCVKTENASDAKRTAATNDKKPYGSLLPPLKRSSVLLSLASFIWLCIRSAATRNHSAGCYWLASLINKDISKARPAKKQPWSSGTAVQDCLIRTAHAWTTATLVEVEHAIMQYVGIAMPDPIFFDGQFDYCGQKYTASSYVVSIGECVVKTFPTKTCWFFRLGGNVVKLVSTSGTLACHQVAYGSAKHYKAYDWYSPTSWGTPKS